MSASGAPDVWMAPFVSTAVIVFCQTKSAGTWMQAVLIGFLAGGIAGAKYTGCLIAASLLVVYLWEFRSFANALLFLAGSLLAGIWPYARNLLWTGDPVFPFLTRRLFPDHVNAVALASLLADTGAANPHPVSRLLPFVFFAGMRLRNLGFWDFYGPLLLAVAPLVLMA